MFYVHMHLHTPRRRNLFPIHFFLPNYPVKNFMVDISLFFFKLEKRMRITKDINHKNILILYIKFVWL